MRPPGARVIPPSPRALRQMYDPTPKTATVRPLVELDVHALLALERPTAVRVVVFDAREPGRILSVRHFEAREPALQAADAVSGLPTAVIVDGPDRACPARCRHRQPCELVAGHAGEHENTTKDGRGWYGWK